MNTLLWLCQNATNWISNPEVEQGEEDQNLLVTSAIAIGAIVTVGALYSLARRNSSLHIPEDGEHAEVIAYAFRHLPEMLQTQENLDALITSGANAEILIGRLPENLRTPENLNVFFKDNDPERLQEIVDELTAINRGGQAITQEQFDEIVRIADENAACYWLKGAVED